MRIKAVLFDLDETLLELDTEPFLESYLSSLGREFSDVAPADEFVGAVWASTGAMLKDRDSSRSNQEVFLDKFFQLVDAEPEDLLPRFDEFYRNVFPELKTFARPHPQARGVVTCCLDRGLEVVVATNPVFPRLAVDERLRWAGLQDLPFSLVTSYEIMHFCKPHAGYFREIADELAVDPGECMMVGDDPELDLVGARAVGMWTYHVMPGKPSGDFSPDLVGDLGLVPRELEGIQ